MILTRAPLRISLGGGGSDLFSYSGKYGGFCVSAAISKYSYVSINRSFQEEILLKYSDIEKVKNPEEIQHPIFREAIKLLNFKTPQIEINSIADIPSRGLGLGGSGSFCVSLLKALHSYRNIPILPERIAEIASDIAINRLGFIQGKQDEYACSLGGIQCLEFEKDGAVNHYPLQLDYDTLIDLDENLLLFYTGINHNTNQILKDQDEKTKENNEDIINNLHEVKELGYRSKICLESGNVREFAVLLNEQWINKWHRQKTDPIIEEMYFEALEYALGGKLIGSGNGGFFMFYAREKSSLRSYAQKRGLQEMKFSFDFEGVKQII
jgi:D-glycero-alpha-D-manno-heptose-7-phosphate kinase